MAGTNRSGGTHRPRGRVGAAAAGPDRLLLPDARLRLRGRGRDPGDAAPRLARAPTPWPRPAALKSWLFTIATNVCLDQIDARKRRARPVDLADPGNAESPLGAPLPETDLGAADRQRPGRRPRRRPRGPDRRARVAAARLRRRAPAPAGAPARRPRPARGAALERQGGRRACSRPRSPRSTARCSGPAPRSTSSTSRTPTPRPGPTTRTSAACSSSTSRRSPSTTSTGIVALLRYDVVFDMPPLPLWVARPRRRRRLHARPRRRLPRLEADRPLRQRPPRLRLLQARPRVGSLAALVGDPAGADRRRRRHGGSPASTTSSPRCCRTLFASFGLPERLEDEDPVIAG